MPSRFLSQSCHTQDTCTRVKHAPESKRTLHRPIRNATTHCAHNRHARTWLPGRRHTLAQCSSSRTRGRSWCGGACWERGPGTAGRVPQHCQCLQARPAQASAGETTCTYTYTVLEQHCTTTLFLKLTGQSTLRTGNVLFLSHTHTLALTFADAHTHRAPGGGDGPRGGAGPAPESGTHMCPVHHTSSKCQELNTVLPQQLPREEVKGGCRRRAIRAHRHLRATVKYAIHKYTTSQFRV